MCRALMYLGVPIGIYDLLYKTDSSLITQSYNPKYMGNFVNLAGFGMVAWNELSKDSQRPYFYKTSDLPFFDTNLSHLASKITANCLLAHVRGTTYSTKSVITQQNVHPFMFEDCRLAMAHNGDLENFNKMKYGLLKWIKPEIAQNIKGTTDSEWVYALILSQLEDPHQNPTVDAVEKAVCKAVRILREVRAEYGIAVASPLNLFITNGHYLVATRFILDFGCFLEHYYVDHLTYQSLWYTFGDKYDYAEGEYKMVGKEKRSSIIISSEPLTEDVTTWVEVPEYSIMSAYLKDGQVRINIQDLEEIIV